MRIYHECEGRIELSVPRITVWHHEACRVMTNGDPEGRIFLFHPHTNNGFFFLLTTVFIYLFQTKISGVLKYAKMQFHMMTLLDVLGNIAWVSSDFLSRGKISDILIRCARKNVLSVHFFFLHQQN